MKLYYVVASPSVGLLFVLLSSFFSSLSLAVSPSLTGCLSFFLSRDVFVFVFVFSDAAFLLSSPSPCYELQYNTVYPYTAVLSGSFGGFYFGIGLGRLN